MKALVVCQGCGKVILEASKDNFSDYDLKELEMSGSCSEHGGNLYERDEDGIIISQQTFFIKAIKKVD